MKKKCVLCDGNEFLLLYNLIEWKIERCKICGLVRTNGKPDVTYDHYHRDEEYLALDNYFRNIFRKRFNLISRFKDPGRVLDIGASTGVMLSIFKDSGWETWGIEPSDAAKVGVERGIKMLKTSFERAKLPKNYFDVVIMNHTLEHVDDPSKVLKKIYSVLRRDGIAYIDVPNFGSLSSQIAGKDWKYLHPYEHIHQFEPETLKKCMEAAGFKVVWSQTCSGIFDVANPILKFWQTLTGLKKQFFTDLTEIPGNIVATALNRGTSLAIIGKKQ